MRIADDLPRLRVGHHRLEPAADLDPDLALVRRHDEQDAVVFVFLADPPFARETDAVILDLVAVERFDGDDGNLIGGLAFERLEFGEDGRLVLRLQQVGVVDDLAGEFGIIRRGDVRAPARGKYAAG